MKVTLINGNEVEIPLEQLLENLRLAMLATRMQKLASATNILTAATQSSLTFETGIDITNSLPVIGIVKVNTWEPTGDNLFFMVPGVYATQCYIPSVTGATLYFPFDKPIEIINPAHNFIIGTDALGNFAANDIVAEVWGYKYQ